ncbi:MAG: DUF4870 domain-containing protein [Candidatus Eremiobacteraeota bacterium]|nr:DUF4870 domain-containing protein [Candidatus Eremiobacteraeota bacterium]
MQTICATCRDEQGICPGCRLERRLQAAGAPRRSIGGRVGPSNPPPPPGPQPRVETAPGPRVTATATMPYHASPLATVSSETRALLGLGYPLWPLAALALLDPTRSPTVRRHATQALALNFGLFGLSVVLKIVSSFWLIGWSAYPLLAAIFPIWLVATFVYGFKVWNGDDVRVPLVSDWLDQRESVPAA